MREKTLFYLKQFDWTISFFGEVEYTYIILYLHILLPQFSLTLYFHSVYVKATLSIKLLNPSLVS